MFGVCGKFRNPKSLKQCYFFPTHNNCIAPFSSVSALFCPSKLFPFGRDNLQIEFGQADDGAEGPNRPGAGFDAIVREKIRPGNSRIVYIHAAAFTPNFLAQLPLRAQTRASAPLFTRDFNVLICEIKQVFILK